MREAEDTVWSFEHWYNEELHHDAIDPENYAQALLDEMEAKRGDMFVWGNETCQVESVDVATGTVKVSDPRTSNPQDARYGQWEENIREVYTAWKQGDVRPASLTIA